MKRVDTNTGRYYELDGVKYPSVTTILGTISKPELNRWVKKMTLDKVQESLAISGISSEEVIKQASVASDTIRDEAANIGSSVHDYIHRYLKGETFAIPEHLSIPYNTFVEFHNTSGLIFIKSEEIVYSKKHVFAGTLDLLVSDPSEGVFIVGDIKTSNNIYQEAYLQVAAYSIAYHEMYGVDIGETFIIRLDKNLSKAEIKVRDKDALERDKSVFLSVLDIYKYLKER